MGRLFVLVALCLALGCGICYAQRSVNLDDEKPSDTTKPADPIVISGDRLASACDVSGQSVIIDANKSTIAINGKCRDLTVNGSDNNIRSCKIESLTVNGNSNLVTYPKSCKPKTEDKGKSNSVIAR